MKKILTFLLMVSLLSLYGCANTESGAVSSDADTATPVESTAESTAESTFESTSDVTDVVTADTEETTEKTIEDAKTVGEALEILFPDVDLDTENISKLGVLISDMEPLTYVEDKAEVLDIFNTVKNAPIVSYEMPGGSPGWRAAITFYGNDGGKLFGFRVSDTIISLRNNVYSFKTEEGYFAEICEFIKSFEK